MHEHKAPWHSLLFNEASDFRYKASCVFYHQLRHLPVYRTFCEHMHRSRLSNIHPDALPGATAFPGPVAPPNSAAWPNSAAPPDSAAPPHQTTTPTDTQPFILFDPDAIPLMPVQAFRDAHILADYINEPEVLFKSSGTSGSVQSTHAVADLSLYLRSCREGFARFYDPDQWSILAWLPGYVDNPHSSLLAMISHFIEQDASGSSRFLPLDRYPTQREIQAIAEQGRRVMLFGAAFGLLDMLDGLRAGVPQGRSAEAPHPSAEAPYPSAEAPHSSAEAPHPSAEAPHPSAEAPHPSAEAPYPSTRKQTDPSTPVLQLPPGSVVVETGGMKTRRRERTREQLHRELAAGFGLPATSIHSEYGMAETSSQAWDNGTGRYRTPPWMRVTIRDAANPMRVLPAGQQGLIGIVDLANVHSLAFMLTQDRGVAWPDGSFQVLGRKRHASLRGCNFLMEPDGPNQRL